MGMLATVINSLAISSALTAIGQKNRVFTAIRMEPVGELYTNQKAVEALKNGEIAIFLVEQETRFHHRYGSCPAWNRD